jgi:hypothetical protein
MKDETIAAHVRTLSGVLASIETNRKLHGQTAKERIASELLQDARSQLLEELAARREPMSEQKYTLQDVKALADTLNVWVNAELGVIDLVPQPVTAGDSISLKWDEDGIQAAMRWLQAREEKKPVLS